MENSEDSEGRKIVCEMDQVKLCEYLQLNLYDSTAAASGLSSAFSISNLGRFKAETRGKTKKNIV